MCRRNATYARAPCRINATPPNNCRIIATEDILCRINATVWLFYVEQVQQAHFEQVQHLQNSVE